MKSIVAVSIMAAGCYAPAESVVTAEDQLSLPGTPFTDMNGARIKHAYLFSTDGYRQGVGPYDTLLDVYVQPLLDSNGVTRFMPAGPAAVFYDATCVTPVYVHIASMCGGTDVPIYIGVYRLTSGPPCYQGHYETWEVLGPIASPPQLYSLITGSCAPYAMPVGAIIHELTQIPNSQLVPAHYETP